MFRFPVPFAGFLFGDHSVRRVRGHLLAGLVAFHFGGFRKHLPNEVRGNFERLMPSGSRALEFLGNQGVTALGNHMLSHQDSLLLNAWCTVPAEEVAHLRCADLPLSPVIFPSALHDSALNKMRAALNYALVQQTLYPPKDSS